MNITINIPEQKIVDALVSACEDGSYYWARTDGLPYDRRGKSLRLPITVIEHLDGAEPVKQYLLNKKALTMGLQLMAEKHPHHFANMLTGNGDWITGDVLLQLSTLGELKYG